MSAEEVVHEISLLTDWWQTVSDPAHILTEMTYGLVEFVVGGLIIGKWMVARHDRKKHGHENCLPVVREASGDREDHTLRQGEDETMPVS